MSSGFECSPVPKLPQGNLVIWNPPSGAVPAEFAAASVSFPSEQLGWALGIASCPTGRCIALLKTTDSGATWAAVEPPPFSILSASPYSFASSIHFADPENGWAFDNTDDFENTSANQMFSTHDGGVSWQPDTLPGSSPTSFPAALNSADGEAYTVMIDPTNTFDIDESSVNHDPWRQTSATIPIGAGPVPMFQLVLEGSSGWIAENDRGVIGGARLSNGVWSPWTPPCMESGYGDLDLTGSGASALAAFCWPSPYSENPSPAALFTSSDGGATFRTITTSLPPALDAGSEELASPGPGVFAFRISDGVMASFDNARTWGRVASFTASTGNEPVLAWGPNLVFLSQSEGYVVTPAGGLAMTFDGGRSWSERAFGGQ